VRILRGDAFRCVNQQERHIRALNRFERAQHAILFDANLNVPRGEYRQCLSV